MNEKYLQRFADDSQMFEAVMVELMKASETRNLDTKITNEELGAEVRARIRAKELVEAEFKRLKTFRTNKQVDKLLNSAR